MIRTTTYAYPWDVARLGPEAVIGDLADKGIAALDLAATYHPIDALSPRGGVHLYSSPRGAVHFPARADRYGKIVPTFDPDPGVRAAWPAVEQTASAHGVGLNSWTVLLFQPWIVDAHPECARTLPNGTPVGQVLCQASPDVQEYYANLCADLADQFDIGTLRLEMAAPPTFDYGWLRPRVLVELTPLARQLLAVCFCPSCQRRANAEGIDVERVRHLVESAIAAEADGPGTPEAAADRSTAIAADPELHAYVVLHERATAELVHATVSLIEGPGRPRVSTIVNSPYDQLLGDDLVSLAAGLVAEVDQILIFASADPSRTKLLADIAGEDPRSVGLATFLVPVDLGVLAGLGDNQDNGDAGDNVRRALRTTGAFGLEEVNIYNYGLLRDEDVTELLQTIREELP
jgi:hypothetical protein